MRSRRNLEALLDEFLGPFRAYRLYAGNWAIPAAGCGWGDSEGGRHLIEIGSDRVPTGGLRIELEIGHELFDLAGGAQHGGDGITLPGLLEFVQYRGSLLFEVDARFMTGLAWLVLRIELFLIAESKRGRNALASALRLLITVSRSLSLRRLGVGDVLRATTSCVSTRTLRAMTVTKEELRLASMVFSS
jgi:hypothetical protein